MRLAEKIFGTTNVIVIGGIKNSGENLFGRI